MRVAFLSAIAAVLVLGVAPSAFADPIITNGSLTGPIDNVGVPTGWTILAGSPDTMDQNNNVGVSGNTAFVTTPSGPSPDGGTWVGFATDGTFKEVFGQTVGGFTVGASYTLSWYAGNFGAIPGPSQYGAANAVMAFLDGSAIGAGAVLASGADWFAQSITFTATSASHQISFGHQDTARSYMSIDGIALTAAVPEPGTLALFGLGAGAFGLARRRRARKNQTA